MAQFGSAQQVRYGSLTAEYSGVPFTLAAWKVARKAAVNAQGQRYGTDVAITASGWIEAAEPSALAAAAASARAALNADGGDFRVSYAAPDPEGGEAIQHTVEEVKSGGLAGGLHADCEVEPAGGCRLKVALSLAGHSDLLEGEQPPSGLPGGAASSTAAYEYADPAGEPARWKASGELQALAGQDARAIWVANVLPVLEAAVPFASATASVRSSSEADGRLCRWEYDATETYAAYPAGVEGGEVETSVQEDADYGVLTVERGRYSGPGAAAVALAKLAAAGDAVQTETTTSRHQTTGVSWTIVRRGSRGGAGDCCVSWREAMRYQWSLGLSRVKEYSSADPVLVAGRAAVLRIVQEGQAVSADPLRPVAVPERWGFGAAAAPDQIDVSRDGRMQLVTSWRYESISIGLPAHLFVLPYRRDEAARFAAPLPGGLFNLRARA